MPNWIIAGLLLIVGSVGTYLFIRKAQGLNIPLEIINISIFAFPILPLILYNTVRDMPIVIDAKYVVMIFTASIFLSWLANITSLKALELAPNPGYSLIISKSYVVFTTFLAVPLFAADVTSKKILSIILIILFSALIIYDKKKDRGFSNINWLWLTLYSFFAWGFLALFSTYLIKQGIQGTTLNIYILSFVSFFIILEILIKKVPVKNFISSHYLRVLIPIGIFFSILAQSMVYGYQVAPNPGYINAVNTSSIAFVTLFSALIFKDDLSIRKFMGVLGMVFGLILLFI